MTTAVTQIMKKTNFDHTCTCKLTMTFGGLSGIMAFSLHVALFACACYTDASFQITVHSYSINCKY